MSYQSKIATMRIALEGIIYHIIQQGNNFEPIFVADSDRLHFLHLLKQCKEKFEIDIFAFCLMDNHIHILLRPSGDNLSKSMHWLFMSYAKRFTAKYQRRGHLFVARFKNILCLNDSYFLQLSRYIHLNPVKARIAKNPFSYRWSSCNLFVKTNLVDKSFVNTDFTLDFYSSNRVQARKLCKKFIWEGIRSKNGFKYPPLLLDKIIGNMEELLAIKDKVPCLGETLSFLKTRQYKDKEYNFYLLSRKKAKIASRDYIIYQKRRKGITFNEIAKQSGLSLRSVMRAINRVEVWRNTYLQFKPIDI